MIFFRADGNEKIGTGHIMRCMSIAEEFISKGESCAFILAQDTFKGYIEEKGCDTYILNSDYTDMRGEIKKLCSLIDRKNPDMIIVDSYYVTPEYLHSLNDICKTVYIDDMLKFPYEVDCIINYNIYGDMERYNDLYYNSNTEMPMTLVGSKYTPLRNEFKKIEKRKIELDVKRVLFSAGGADPEHMTRRLVKYIQKNPNRYIFDIVVGTANTDLDEIIKMSDGEKIVVHSNVKNMSLLMMQCDVAVSAAGTTLYELCACGIPTITYILADNQINSANAFESCGVMKLLGDIRKQSGIEEKIISKIDALAGDKTAREKMSKSMQTLVDGQGTRRIADMLL